MVGVHYNGTFYEAVPWNGSMEWNVSTWGLWDMRGQCTSGGRRFAVEVKFECDPKVFPGLVFRAPTPDEGMVYSCKDTFEASVNLSLWDLEYDQERKEFVRIYPPVIDNARSKQGGAEVGGGPWWDLWIGKSELKKPIKALLRLPSAVRKKLKPKKRKSEYS
jgi:tocopherol cyclase